MGILFLWWNLTIQIPNTSFLNRQYNFNIFILFFFIRRLLSLHFGIKFLFFGFLICICTISWCFHTFFSFFWLTIIFSFLSNSSTLTDLLLSWMIIYVFIIFSLLFFFLLSILNFVLIIPLLELFVFWYSWHSFAIFLLFLIWEHKICKCLLSFLYLILLLLCSLICLRWTVFLFNSLCRGNINHFIFYFYFSFNCWIAGFLIWNNL